MFNINENYSDPTPEAEKKETKVIPVIFLVSLEPVIVRASSDAVPEDQESQALIEHATFDISFSVIKNIESNLYSVTFLVKPFGTGLMQTISEKFESMESPEAKEFIEYSFSVFEPFKRAVLTFEDNKEVELTELITQVRAWKQSVKKELEEEE